MPFFAPKRSGVLGRISRVLGSPNGEKTPEELPNFFGGGPQDFPRSRETFPPKTAPTLFWGRIRCKTGKSRFWRLFSALFLGWKSWNTEPGAASFWSDFAFFSYFPPGFPAEPGYRGNSGSKTPFPGRFPGCFLGPQTVPSARKRNGGGEKDPKTKRKTGGKAAIRRLRGRLGKIPPRVATAAPA